jgi:hypothetical protein
MDGLVDDWRAIVASTSASLAVDTKDAEEREAGRRDPPPPHEDDDAPTREGTTAV